jgi:hypothetical protein
MPYVLGLEDDRQLAAAGQLVYVRGMVGAQPGQMVQVVRPLHRYTRDRDSIHSSTLDFRGDKIHRDYDPEDRAWHELWTDYTRGERNGYAGTEVMVQSVGQVTHVKGEITTVLLRSEERDVHVGDRVMPMDAQAYDLQFYPQPPTQAIPSDALVLGDGRRPVRFRSELRRCPVDRQSDGDQERHHVLDLAPGCDSPGYRGASEFAQGESRQGRHAG